MTRYLGTLLEDLRGMTDAQYNEYTVGTVTYWSDDALTTIMDKWRADFYYQEARSEIDYLASGSVAWTRYYIGYDNLEQGTALIVESPTGDDYSGTAYTVDYRNGVITWAYDTTGSSVMVTGRSYNLNAAAAEVWRKKASHAAKMYDFSTDNHSLKRSQYMDHCLKMADYYSRQTPRASVTLWRTDTDG